MSNISDAFKNGKAFIGFVTAGDPDLDTSLEIMTSMAQGGCDLIEIGIPFSDPIAEGPVIQEADLRSLENGTTTDKVFDLTKKLREKVDIPLVYMTYLNVLFKYGYDRFLQNAKESGVSVFELSLWSPADIRNSAFGRMCFPTSSVLFHASPSCCTLSPAPIWGSPTNKNFTPSPCFAVVKLKTSECAPFFLLHNR